MTKLTYIIKKRRKELSISQCKLAREMGFINGQFISNIERGGAEYPPSYFKDVSRTLKIPLKKLIKAAVEDYHIWLSHHIKGK